MVREIASEKDVVIIRRPDWTFVEVVCEGQAGAERGFQIVDPDVGADAAGPRHRYAVTAWRERAGEQTAGGIAYVRYSKAQFFSLAIEPNQALAAGHCCQEHERAVAGSGKICRSAIKCHANSVAHH